MLRDAACVRACGKLFEVIPSAELEQEAPEEQDAQDDHDGDDDDFDETQGRSSAFDGRAPKPLKDLHSIGVKPGLSTPSGRPRARDEKLPDA